MTAPLPPPEFSRPVAAEPLPPNGRTVAVDADAEERRRLAARFGLERLDRFGGTVVLRPLGAKRGVVRVEMTGQFEADAVQTCVVTLAPLPCRVSEPVRLRFSSQPDADPGGDLDIDPDADDDPPDPIVDGMIDVGEALSEALGLALDPHPRASDAHLETTTFGKDPARGGDWGGDWGGDLSKKGNGNGDDRPAASPFAALAALKKGSRENG